MRMADITPTETEAQQTETQRRFLLGSLIFGHTVIHWYQQLFPVILPSIKDTLGLNDVEIGTLSAVREGAGGILIMPSGYLADSFAKYRPYILAFALVSSGVAYFLVGLALSYLWILPGIAMIGLASAAWHPASVGSLSSRFPERRGTALAMHGVGASIGDTISPLLIGALLLVVGWQTLLQWHLLPALVLAFIIWRSLGSQYKDAGPGPSAKNYLSGIKDMLKERSVLAIMSAGVFMSMGRLSVLTFLPIYLTEDLNLSTLGLGFYLMLLYLMGMVSQPIMGIVSDKFGRKVVLLPAYISLGVLYLVIPATGNGFQLALVIGTMGLFFYGTGNIATAAVMDLSSSQVQGSTMSVMSVFRHVFTLPSPIIAGVIVTVWGTEAAFIYAGALLLVGALIIAAIKLPRKPDAAPKPA
jgi:sugar phosphate permease